MAFHLMSSNTMEQLTANLAARLLEKPLQSVLAPEVVVVPSLTVARWLSLNMAQISGIHCNVTHPMPAAWLWDQLSTRFGSAVKQDPLSKESATWKIFELLPRFLPHPSFASLQHYLGQDAGGLKRWQLSERIADVLDRYQYYRPEMIRQWSDGDDASGEQDNWQALLWRALQEPVGVHHRVALMDMFIEALQQGRVKNLPERVSLFAIASLPPLLLQVMQAMAQRMDVDLYYLTPTAGYWADLKSAKAMAQVRLKQPDDAVYFEIGHELLASWGKQGQVFQDLLLSDGDLDALTFEGYREVWPDSLLGQLQQGIFELAAPENPQQQADASLQLHVCHSAMRECQVLHDALLQRLSDDPTLKPEDILVMVPNISGYAPYIQAVFGKDEARVNLPFNLSDTSVADEHPVIGAFLQLLRLPESRFALSELLSLLDTPEISAAFDLSGDDVQLIRDMLHPLHVRWGMDGEHKASFGLPPTIENSWKQAEQRLMAGYAMGESALWHGLKPYPLMDSEALVWAKFWRLFEALNRWRQTLAESKERTGSDWQQLLMQLLEQLFVEGTDQDGRLQWIRDALANMVKYADKIAVTLELLRYQLSRELTEHTAAARYFSGGVTFCGMKPLRSVPFRVICLLGMQDADFPRREKNLEFDQMSGWSPGDPSLGEMDRYLMLETLLCAKEALHISYVGRSIRDNSDCQPSVLVQELLDYMAQHYSPELLKMLIQVHPMQPFSAKNYQAFQSYDRYWCELANRMEQRDKVSAAQRWPDMRLPLVREDTQLELHHLVQFAKHPVKYFINHRLSIYLDELDEHVDDEPFVLDHLELWTLKDAMLRDGLKHGDASELLERIKADGVLPHGLLGDQLLSTQLATLQPMMVQLERYQAIQAEPYAIELELMEGGRKVRLVGQIPYYYPSLGLLRVTPSKRSGKQQLGLWLEHLALCASNQLKEQEVSRLICSDGGMVLKPVKSQEAKEALQVWLAMWAEGSCAPLPIFPKCSPWIAENKEGAAEKMWEGNEYQKIAGEREDAYIAWVMRHVSAPPLNDPRAKVWAEKIYQPLWDAGEKV